MRVSRGPVSPSIRVALSQPSSMDIRHPLGVPLRSTLEEEEAITKVHILQALSKAKTLKNLKQIVSLNLVKGPHNIKH